MTRSAAVIASAVLVAAPAAVHAGEGPLLDIEDKPFVLVGLAVGYVSADGQSGLLGGGEASVGYFTKTRRGWWFGGYVDTLFDEVQAPRTSIGVEGGMGFIGIDLGPVFQFEDDGLRIRGRARAFLTVGMFGIGAGPVFPVGDGGGWSAEVSLLAKWSFLN